MDEADAASRYREEEADSEIRNDGKNSDSTRGEHQQNIVSWAADDPENPYNWSNAKKSFILLATMLTIINSTMGSALPSNAVPYMMELWGVTSEQQRVLPISVFLIGYVMGPLVWAPLSEQYGRRDWVLGTFTVFMIFTIACAVSPNWPAFLVFRLFTGIVASGPNAISTGIFADIYDDPLTRGRVMSLFQVSTMFGSLVAPIISGFCSPTIGWRWTFWVGVIYAAASMIPLVFLPETYGPVLLQRRAQGIRKLVPSSQAISPHELERKDLRELATIVLTRPLRMMVFEPIVYSSSIYLSLVYAVFYMSFEAYPLIFQGVYGLSPGVCGLTYLAIGGGCLLSVPACWYYDAILQRAQERSEPWTRREEFRRLPLACVGGPMFVVSLFWLGWTAREDISFVAPMLAGLPFGFGFMCIFFALLNYLTDAYEIFAASANAAASCTRSVVAVVLPLAATPMFNRLGIAGACSLLGGLATLMCGIPFVFIWQGETIRANSRFCIALRERKAEKAWHLEAQFQKQQYGERRSDASVLMKRSKEEV